ncbi:MAG: acetyl-CoA carboxylase biotin carboxylase subunit [Bradyrhizobium sp.]|jgi:acetyl-CoA carboxylase biotin carboxylase subunit
MIRRVLVANRGEIAVRVIRGCRDLGMEAIVAHSDVDRDSLAVRQADRAVCIGAAPPRSSYLNMEVILAAAKAVRADAIHPGYGFLSENAAFAQACQKAGTVFIGPSAAAIALMGNKLEARRAAADAGVPVLPGSFALVQDPEQATAVARSIGFPVLLKASAGGGGLGLRRVNDATEFSHALAMSANEAQQAFGDGALYIEKYIPNARHIEVQIVADHSGRLVELGERDCSIQRRYQKLIEESPSPCVSPALRDEMAAAAIRLVRRIGYTSAGTIEFLLDQDTRRFYFIEMNTRLQVEHPVTEMVTGLDIVALQLLIASGMPLPVAQEDVRFRGHAIEFRINAEDPAADFQPCAGRLAGLSLPLGPGVRVDTHCYEGYTVPPFYDSLLAKIIVHGETRELALARSRRALRECTVAGVKTTLPLYRELLEDNAFLESRTNTQWIAERLDSRAETR